MVVDCTAAWDKCLGIIKSRIGEKGYNTWFRPIIPLEIVGSSLKIQVPSQFFYEWLEEHYVAVLKEAIDTVLGVNGKLEYSIVVDKGNQTNKPYVVNYQASNHRRNPVQEQKTVSNTRNPFDLQPFDSVTFKTQLNPKFTFDNMVEGECNRLGRSAGIAVANKPGLTSFNPLFIFGEVGQGKTHVAQAIGNKVTDNNAGKVVLYVQSEKFANQAIEAFKNNSVQEFANYYLQVDVLILDDVQFLCGKARTQELFFHIFNHLHQNGKQIVLTSDCAPNELNGLEERLISRFKWGLSAEMTQPDFETRMAIIYKRLEADGVVMPQEVIEYLAYSVETNVRELEGVIISLIAQASLNKREIDLDLAKNALHRIVKNIDVEVNIDYIQKFVSNYFDTPVDLMKGKTRKREVVVPRQVSMYLTKEFTNMSLKSIGYHFGNRDHSTVIHAIKTVNDMMDTDQKFYSLMQDVLKKVKMKAS